MKTPSGSGAVLPFRTPDQPWTPADLAALRAPLPIHAEDGRVLLTAEEVAAYREAMVRVTEIRWTFR